MANAHHRTQSDLMRRAPDADRRPTWPRSASLGKGFALMRKIMSSLFVIVSLLGVGIFATGAYFSDTINQNNYTFTTGSADLKFGFCGPLGAFCDSSTATLDSYTFSTSQTTGPGIEASNCIVVKNTGVYTLNLSSQLTLTAYSHPDMATFFQVAADTANNNCVSTGGLRPWAAAVSEATAGQVSLGISLAPGASTYFILYNRWDSSGDQNYLQGGYLKLNTALEGRTS